MEFEQYEETLNVLNSVYPDKGTTSIRPQKLKMCKDPERMLDIIVPAYNVEHYVDECIHSILKQKTQYTYRIIIIDDGSKDSTGSQIDKYQDIESVLIIHQSNMGQAAARNVGLNMSDAKYIMFVDSDDVLPVFAVEKLITAAELENADIAAGSYYNFRKFKWLKKEYCQKKGIVSDLDLNGQPWAKVMTRKLLECVQFPEKYLYEDSVLHQIVYPNAVKKVGIRDIVYQRRNNLNSITHINIGNPRNLDSLWVTLRLMEDRKLLGMHGTDMYYEYLLGQTVLTHKRLSKLEPEIQECAFHVMCYQINEKFPEYKTQKKGLIQYEESIRNADFENFCTIISAQQR